MSAPRRAFQLRTDAVDVALITEKNDTHDMMLATLNAEPIESTDPTEPIDRIEPADPMDRIDPVEPIERIEPLLVGFFAGRTIPPS